MFLKPVYLISIFLILVLSINSVNGATILFLQISPEKVAADTLSAISGTKCLPSDCHIQSTSEPSKPLAASTDADLPVLPADGRLIIEVNSWIIPDDSCACAVVETKHGGFRNYAFLGLGFIPALFPLIGNFQQNDIPIPSNPSTASPMRRRS